MNNLKIIFGIYTVEEFDELIDFAWFDTVDGSFYTEFIGIRQSIIILHKRRKELQLLDKADNVIG